MFGSATAWRRASAVPHRYRALVALAAGTGLRWGECTGLRWDAIDLPGGVLRVVRVEGPSVEGPSTCTFPGRGGRI